MIHHPSTIPLPTAKSFTLSNGFKSVHVQDNSNPLLCLQLYIRTGSVHESAQQRGYSHFLEHLAFKATRDFPQNNLSRYASSLGGMLNAYTDYDSTCYYLLLPSENLSQGLCVLSQLAMHASFTVNDVETEKDIILEEIKQYQNDPEPDHIEWIQTTYFIKSPLKYPVLGCPESIKAATHKSLQSYYKRQYRPQNAFLVVCGNYQNDQLTGLIDSYFAAWQAGGAAVKPVKTTEPESITFRSFFRLREQSEDYLSITMPELCEQHPMADAMLIAMRYLAIGKSSRLFKRLVEEDKLCSAVKVSSLSGMLSGVSTVCCSPLSRKHIPKIISVIAEELSRLMAGSIPADELHLVKQDIIHSWLYSFEGMENLANLVAVEEFIGNLDRLQSYGERINNISLEQVMQAVHKYWLPNRLAVYYEGAKELTGFTEIALRVKNIKPSIVHPHSDNKRQKTNAIPILSTCQPSMPATLKPSIVSEIAENHYQFYLSNGMQVLFRQLPSKSVSGFSLSTHISQLSESEQYFGHNYFTSSMLLYSTQFHSHEELMRYGREHGFNIRAIHHLDSTSFRGKCQTTNLDKALSTLAEIIRYPRFDGKHLNLLRSATLDGIRRDNDYPVSYAYQKWFKLLVGSKSNLYRSCGNPDRIRAIRLRDITAWYKEWNLNRDFCLAIVGSHELNYVTDLCENLFGFTNPDSPSLINTPVWESSNRHFQRQYHETDQAIIHLGGFATPAENHAENAAFYLLAQILGGDISSRFFDVIREKHGLAYQTGFDFSSINELGFWSAYAFCSQRDYKKCLALMQDIIHDVVENGVETEELERAKRYLIGMNRFDLESVSYSASSISNLAALGYEPQYYLQREERINNVNRELIKHIAAKWLTPENQYLHILV